MKKSEIQQRLLEIGKKRQEIIERRAKKLNRDLVKLAEEEDNIRSQCRHKWGDWSYGYELPSYRTCLICYKEESR